MIYLFNLDANVKLGFDFLENLPDDFETAENKFEKWVPFVLSISTPEKIVGITEAIQAHMTVYEVEKIYCGLNALVNSVKEKDRGQFSHYSNENYFEIKFEYLHEDECVDVELWFMIAECAEGRIEGHRIGFGFVASMDEVKNFVSKYKERFAQVCPQIPLG